MIKFKIAPLALASLFYLYGCENTQTKTEEKNETATTETTTTGTTENVTQEQTTPADELLAPYIDLKNALAADDDKKAAEAGKALLTELNEFNTTTVDKASLKEFNEMSEDAKEHADHISKNIGNIVHQREHFALLSEDMYDMAKLLGTGKKMYFMNCSMYNNNEGANWLSESKEVRNPYFGDEMLTCGTVEEELE